MKKLLNFFKKLFIFFLIAITLGLVLARVLIGVSQNLRFEVELDTFAPNVLTKVYDRNGILLAELVAEKRDVIPIEQIPDYMIYAIVSAEDQNFFNHNGFDPKAMLRAIIVDIKAGKFKEGGSTISQQLAKNMTLKTQKKMSRKIKEAFFTLKIEKKYSKIEILELYLNQVYFGYVYGVQEAAGFYFGKDAKDLTLAECAMLVGITRRPAYYNPYKYFENAKQRQKYVLMRMVDDGYITIKQANDAYKEELEIKRKPVVEKKAPYFVDYILKYLLEKYGVAKTYNGGLIVKTTLDYEIQKIAEESFRQINEERANLEEPEPPLQGGIIILDNMTGQILAMVGGNDYESSKWNRAVQATRQPGSLFKVFLYTAYLDNGRGTLADLWFDSPIVFPELKTKKPEEDDEQDTETTAVNIPDTANLTAAELKELDTFSDSLALTIEGDTMTEELEEEPDVGYIPNNFGNKYYGMVNVRRAIRSSINTIAIKVTYSIGMQTVVSYAHRLGIRSPLKPVLTIALGANEVTLLETASAVSTLPNEGIRVEPTGILEIKDYKGNLYEKYIPRRKKVLDEKTAFLMNHVLQDVVRRGSGWRARIPGQIIAGKTGTTNNFTDAWFIGYTREYTCGIYIGNDNPAESLGENKTGGRVAAPIWKRIMIEVLKDKDPIEFRVPEGIVFKEIDPKTGLLAGSETEEKYREAFVKGTEPSKYSSSVQETRSKDLMQHFDFLKF